MDKLKKFFDLNYGNRDYTDKSTLDKGKTVLISSQGIDNGVYGFFDIPIKYKPPIITVPRTGSIGHAFVQLINCNATDDCIILKPKGNYSKEFLFYVSAIIRRTKWRYNYGRKITPERISKLEILNPHNFKRRISYEFLLRKLYPRRETTKHHVRKIKKSRVFSIAELFQLERGQFHAIDRLEKGKIPTVSRTSNDNGLVGFYKKPKSAKVYPSFTITVSTVTGDAFLQINPFIATDNVVMCMPKDNLKITTLMFIVAILNRIKWRYSYGRQPYKRIFQKTTIILPIKNNGEVDEDYIEELVSSQPYWNYFNKKFCLNPR